MKGDEAPLAAHFACIGRFEKCYLCLCFIAASAEPYYRFIIIIIIIPINIIARCQVEDYSLNNVCTLVRNT